MLGMMIAMLVITGSIAYDYIMDFPGNFGDHILPDQIHNINLSFIVKTFAKRRGGTAGNVSYTLGLLDTPNVLFSTIGKDYSEYKKGFLAHGAQWKGVEIDRSEYTATGFAMTDKNDNQIWGFFYGASEKNVTLQLKKVIRNSTTASMVLVGPSGAQATMHMVDECVSHNLSYMFDPGFVLTQISEEQLKKGIQYSSYVIGNDYEINLIKERLGNWRDLFSKKVIITTLGKQGSIIEKEQMKISVPAAQPHAVVDPTGAGDAWRGGFLAGMERGFDLEVCGQMGSTAASFAVEQYGTQEQVYSLQDFHLRYEKTFGKKLVL